MLGCQGVRKNNSPRYPITLSPRHPRLAPSPSTWLLRKRVIQHVARQELREAVFGWSLYLTAATAVLLSAVFVYNSMRAVADSGLDIVARPFYAPVLVTTSLAALYLAGWSTLSIARPRDQGALRVLFFAPVDAVGLLGAHLLAALVQYVLLILMSIPLLALLAVLTNLPFPPSLLLGILVSPAYVLPAIAIGLLISAVAPSARGAVFLLSAALALLLVPQVSYSALSQIQPTSRYYDAMLFLREALAAVGEALHWLSPLALLIEGLDAALRDNWREVFQHAVNGLVGGTVWLTLAVWALGRRGVLP